MIVLKSTRKIPLITLILFVLLSSILFGCSRTKAGLPKGTGNSGVSNTVQPTPSVSNTPQPTPSASSTPQLTPAISDTPQPTPSISSAPKPTPSATSTPKPTPTGGNTPKPTSAITATPQPTPTVTTQPPTGDENKGILEVSFNFLRKGTASSQYAVWIEDTAGKLIRTLFVTNFTADGGYTYRKESIPTWVSKANLPNLSSSEIDAISGPTPMIGKQIYKWDGKDASGKAVPNGEYRFFLEGTFFWSSEVLYCGSVNIGGKSADSISMTPTYTSSDTNNRDMLANVSARYYYPQK